MMGAEAIKELLKRVEIVELSIELRERMKTETSLQKKLKYSKRLEDCGGLPQVGQPAAVDDSGCDSGDPA